MIKNILTIAGTDPSGGAGIQADIKTFSALRTYAMSVITAVVAQNTQGVRSFQIMDPKMVADQIDAIFQDIHVDAVKIGMLGNELIVRIVAQKLREYNVAKVVIDPVMVAKSGDHLINDAAVNALKDELFPLATLITPNIPEACVLLNRDDPITMLEMKEEAQKLLSFGSHWVLLKGGHLEGFNCLDVLCNKNEIFDYEDERVLTNNNHGTGCTLSSAITALIPVMEIPDAVREAKTYLGHALKAGNQLQVGKGHGPVNHFYRIWNL
ncbi:bifunctional hydroxymethylpyrimidine kinase/phosphomethylpyrimidine kinase [Commensalibacter sp. M0402]|uniref:bifunctional hydroxymethylpyrimidine kinase/phosphomethylpyrimidine kinase n=1 Tax=Commensalibacter TaxID=1079922 RepID=UPI0018DB8929|nr:MULTISPECIES: bifunctional hydroxymethylpyrimidine kinase/phosphomethylpyrimidine kinase [Commensalibacter]MBI0082649.1 bifunctional hydroxymethylpyrimidine kinase/phosphomethylpyrimidine kinase [Commensalibacter sp. W6292M3]MBI0087459.1 bifunctional hydroxymethylpyrimidine kinase/phosphomethylpyrimidine kinase [Commensalibacter melissae]